MFVDLLESMQNTKFLQFTYCGTSDSPNSIHITCANCNEQNAYLLVIVTITQSFMGQVAQLDTLSGHSIRKHCAKMPVTTMLTYP